MSYCTKEVLAILLQWQISWHKPQIQAPNIFGTETTLKDWFLDFFVKAGVANLTEIL